MLRRPFLPRRGPQRVEARVIQALRRAHRLMDMGQFAQAFPVFLRLAQGAARLGMPLRAAPLYLQAAHARLEMGGADEAVELAQHGIRLLAQAGRAERAQTVIQALIGMLQERGLTAHAVALRAELAALLGNMPQTSVAGPRGHLPTRCPACNGPVRPDQVEWIDEENAECAFCGSVMRRET